MRNHCLLLTALVLTSGICVAQQPGYVEVWTAKIKQDRFTEFGSLANRLADANRRGKGDNFTTYMDFYGRDGRVYYASGRDSAADIEPAMGKFVASIKEYMGFFTMERFMAETSKLVDESQSELRRRRPDLSWGYADQAEWLKTLGSSRYLMQIRITVKPGRQFDAEKQLLAVKQAGENSGTKRATAVSQLVAGRPGSIYFATIPLKNMADLDNVPTVRAMMGDSAYESYSHEMAQNLGEVDYRILRAVPEWSNPPKAIADADPKFWSAKPAVTPMPKKTPAAEPAKSQKPGM